MGTITKRYDPEKNLTVLTVTGKVSRGEYEDVIHDFYRQGPAAGDVLWDLSPARVDHLEAADVLDIARVSRSFFSSRKDGNTAIVATSDLAFGLARMFEMAAEESERSFTIRIFRTVDEALQWFSETLE